MMTKEERNKELQALMATQDGMLAIIALYHQKATPHHQKATPPGQPGSLGRIGLLGCQMIPQILDVEFPPPH